ERGRRGPGRCLSDPSGIVSCMPDSALALKNLGSAELLAATHDLARRSCNVEADLLLHLAEVDQRKLYLERPFPSMFAFCVDELGFSDDAAYYRITVARAGRRFPAIIDAVREGKVHLAGLRLLVPHLTEENHRRVRARATGRSRREIELMVARLAPPPPVPDSIRSVGVPAPGAATSAALLAQSPIAARPPGTSGVGAAG